jgi:hypothetical protein
MVDGPGKYDDLCTFVREQVGAAENGAVMVVVLNGNRGTGFSVQGDPKIAQVMPDLLESVVKQMRIELKVSK